ncbi:MAG: hypothetical protein AAB270_08145, partial [Chloroflexota bacterium]
CWGPTFLERLEPHAEGFYRELARFSRDFLAREMQQLRVQPRPAAPVVLSGLEGEDCSGCSWGEAE